MSNIANKFFFVFWYKIELVNMVVGVLNLEGHLNCMITFKVTTILPPLKKNQKLQISAVDRGGGIIGKRRN